MTNNPYCITAGTPERDKQADVAYAFDGLFHLYLCRYIPRINHLSGFLSVWLPLRSWFSPFRPCQESLQVEDVSRIRTGYGLA